MTEDSEIKKLEQQITELEVRLAILEEEAQDSEYVRSMRRYDVQVMLALLDAIEEMQDVLANSLGAEFNNKLISLPINDWVNETRRELRKSGQ